MHTQHRGLPKTSSVLSPKGSPPRPFSYQAVLRPRVRPSPLAAFRHLLECDGGQWGTGGGGVPQSSHHSPVSRAEKRGERTGKAPGNLSQAGGRENEK